MKKEAYQCLIPPCTSAYLIYRWVKNWLSGSMHLQKQKFQKKCCIQ